MLWVGGNIFIHGLHELGLHLPSEWIAHFASTLSGAVSEGLTSTVNWLATAFADGIFGFALGSMIVLVLANVIEPIFGRKKASSHHS